MKTKNLCIPRLRAGGNNNGDVINNSKTSRAPAMRLLDRFREAVFRLIMLSALSKSSTAAAATQVRVSRSYCNPADPHHSEAVADCIEFIKQKALTDHDHDGDDELDAHSTSIAATNNELVIPVPVVRVNLQ